MNCYGQCYSDSGADRNFFTKKEKVELLRKYKEDLDNESKGVSEKIKDLEESE